MGMKISDKIQFGIFLLMALGLLGAVLGDWLDGRYAKAETVQGLQGEVHAIWMHIVPENERKNGSHSN